MTAEAHLALGFVSLLFVGHLAITLIDYNKWKKYDRYIYRREG